MFGVTASLKYQRNCEALKRYSFTNLLDNIVLVYITLDPVQ